MTTLEPVRHLESRLLGFYASFEIAGNKFPFFGNVKNGLRRSEAMSLDLRDTVGKVRVAVVICAPSKLSAELVAPARSGNGASLSA